MAKSDQNYRPLILVTNDDGITAPGIRNLVEAMQAIGDVVVVAPDSPQSGMGHAITIGEPLRLNKVDVLPGVEAWQCSGTPVDCVKLARDKILKRKPDICVSGINHGSNSSINIIYSGTMSAAMEAAIEGIPSVGFSLLDFSYDADFSVSRTVATKIVSQMLDQGMPDHFLLNVNIPKGDASEFKGIKICRQAHAKWAEAFDHRKDPRGKDYYWMVGRFVNLDEHDGTDVDALKQGFASVVPVKIDFTDHDMRKKLEQDWKELTKE